MAPGRKMSAGVAALLLLTFVSGCGNGNGVESRHERRELVVQRPFAGTHPIKAVCTTGMVADLVRNIGGERVQVTQLMGEGVDPHRYKASIGDVHKLNGADIVFYSGLHLEG